MADKNSSQPVRKKTYTAEEAAKLLQESDSELSESDEFSESEDDSSFLSSDTTEEEVLSSSEDLPSNDQPITVQRGQASQADRTNNIDNISWVSNPPVNYSKEQEFTGTPGVTGEVTNADPLAIFQLFFTNELAEQIVTETNRYAKQCIARKQVKNNSRDKRWKPLTISELKAYEGIILYRGVVWKPTFSHY